MWRGTTPTHNFTIPNDISLAGVSTIQITYCQKGNVILQYKTSDVTVAGQVISVTLTQEDTMKFDRSYNVEIQVRLLMASGSALASNIITEDVNRCLDDNILL